MQLIYQTIKNVNHGNCLQTAYASLLGLPIEEIPNFRELYLLDKQNGTDRWIGHLFDFLKKHGVDFLGTLYNPNLAGKNYKRTLLDIKNYEGIDGYFHATVRSPKYWESNGMKHAVIIDKDLNIVNPINDEYIGMTKFPGWEEIGFNGIESIELLKRV